MMNGSDRDRFRVTVLCRPNTMMNRRINRVPYSEMSQGRFYDEYMMKNQPVLLSETPRPEGLGVDDWITDDGTLLLERLLEIHGNNVVPVVRCDDDESSTNCYSGCNAENMTLKDYLCNECSPTCYLKDWHFQW